MLLLTEANFSLLNKKMPEKVKHTHTLTHTPYKLALTHTLSERGRERERERDKMHEKSSVGIRITPRISDQMSYYLLFE